MPTLTSKITPGRGFNKINDLYVEVWINDPGQDFLLGAAWTNPQGEFSITYEDDELAGAAGTSRTLAYMKIYQEGKLIRNTIDKPSAIIRNTLAAVTVAMVSNKSITARMVEGVIATPNGKGIPGLIVRAYNKTTKTEIFLSEGKTGDKGVYRIYYTGSSEIRRIRITGTDLVVKAYSKRKDKEPLIESPLIVNALAKETINLSAGEGEYKGPDTYTTLKESLESHIGNSKPEAVSQRDVLVMANTEDLEVDEVAFYVQALQWSASRQGLPAEVYFGWFKSGLPGDWNELINTPVVQLVEAIQQAIAENHIPAETEKWVKGLETKIAGWASEEVLNTKGEKREKGSIGDLLSSSKLTADQRKQLLTDWQNEEGGITEFWARQQTKLGSQNYKDLELTLQLGAVTRNHIPLIQALKQKSNVNTIQQIAALQEEDWFRLMDEEKLDIPDDIPGADMNARRKEFSTQLRAITEELVPTAVLGWSFKKDKDIDSTTLDRFLDRNPDFEFRSTTVKAYLKQHPNSLEDTTNREETQKELEAVQRIFHLTPARDKYAGAKILWQNKLHSAYAITMIGLSGLKDMFEGKEELAERIYQKASSRHSRSRMFKMQLHALSTPVYGMVSGIKDLAKLMEDTADLEALFGDQGYCKCKHCDSFFSPSAYLADLFIFLNKIQVNKKGTKPDQDTALEKLFKRRPDLGNIELDCENSHTPLPYIDLVNEVMESVIAPMMYQQKQVNILGKTFTLPVANVPQTESDAATLKAYPQHSRKAAYTTLISGENDQPPGFPWILPFNLWLLELRTYLNHLGLSRADLMGSALSQVKDKTAVAAEYLNISTEELSIFSETIVGPMTTQRYWGADKDQLEKVPVFLKQTGYSYEKLTLLLQMRCLQPVKSILFTPLSSCSVNDATIPDLTDVIVSRIHKFGRFLLKTGEDMIRLDRTIMAFGGTINKQFISHYADLVRVEELVKLKDRKELLSWWGPLEREDYASDPSLYTRLFMTPERILAFRLNNDKTELLTPGVVIDPKAAPLDPDLLAPILSATRLKAKDIELLITEEFPGQVITLNLAQLSYLYRTASFCRAMRFNMTDYLALKKVMGFQPVAGMDETMDPGITLKFIEQYNTLKQAGFNPEMLNYMLRHSFRENAPFALTSAEAERILKLLQATLNLQLSEVFPPGTTVKEKVETKLKLIIGTSDETQLELVNSIRDIIEGTSSLGVPEQEMLIGNQMVFFPDKQEAKTKLLAGGLTNPEERLDYAWQAINKFLIEDAIVQQLSETMAVPQLVMLPLLKELIKHPSSATARAIDVFLSESFINADPATTWSNNELPDAFFVLIKLHKTGILINTLELKLPDLFFIMKQANNNGIADFNTIPVTENNAISLTADWIRLFQLAIINKNSFPDDHTIFELLAGTATAGGTADSLLHKLSELTGWKSGDLQYLAGTEGLNLTYPGDYVDGQWLISMAATLNMVDRVGATAKQMASWTVKGITKTQADSVRHAAMAKYGEQQWQQITVPLRNNIREAQRDALVQYVLHYKTKHTGGKFADIDDIYSYFLVDTQMAACTDTSRIVLAASAVQLFVQRIMMNLEPGMSVTPEFIKEWKWRKYYRVWEANRKVFMWPENWIEPELRDDKTPLFRELENDLMQSELNAGTVEKAYVNYLEKLHSIAHLKVVGLYEEYDVLHVIAATAGKPAYYYYRRWENKSRWTAWEKIELDIINGEEENSSSGGVLLTPIVHNNRLFIFWPVFKLKKEPPSTEDENAIDGKKVAIDDLNLEIRSAEREISKMSREIDILKEKAVDISKIDKAIEFIDLSDYVDDLKEIVKGLEEKIAGKNEFIVSKKKEIREIEEDIRDKEQGYRRYKIAMAWSQYRDGNWTPKKISQWEIYTPLFTGYFTGGARIKNYAIRPIKETDGTLVLRVAYCKGDSVYFFASRFEYNDVRSDMDTYSISHSGKKKLAVKMKYPMSYMKSLVGDNIFSIYSASGKKINLLEKNGSGASFVRSFQTDFYRTGESFFYSDLEHSFFISPPSVNLALNKAPVQVGSTSLRSGSGALQDSAFRLLLPPSGKEAGRKSEPIELEAMAVTGKTFYSKGDTSQVIVRDKKGNKKLELAKKMDNSFGIIAVADNVSFNPAKTKLTFQANGYAFYLFYHPYTHLFLKTVNRVGIEGLLNPDPKTADGKELLYQAVPSRMTGQQFKDKYKPNLSEVNWFNVKEDIDFTHGGVYATYNWELFYHIPLFIATRLSQDQRFDEAQNWFHYIFDPTEPQGEVPYRFWKIKPFHTYTIAQIKDDMEAVLKGGDSIKQQIRAWEENPFNPHMLARFRRLAYMKTVVMKYLDNLVAWGDQLFRMDSIESMNEATQLYVLAGQILGKIPVETEAKPRQSKSFNELAATLTNMGNAWVDLENNMTDEYDDDEPKWTMAKEKTQFSKAGTNPKIKKIKTKLTGTGADASILDDILYFCMSPNEKLLSYWDTVADRLFKIRNCMNIEGLVRSVPLFQPPIDPALLVRAAAAGMDISSAINDLYAPMPSYRFQVLVQKAQELCQELKSLGGALLSALEKKDGELVAQIRSQHEIQLLEANKDIKKHQVEEARLSLAALEESYKLAEIRYKNYSERDFINPAEAVAMVSSAAATVLQAIAVGVSAAGAVAAQTPEVTLGAHAQSMASGSSATTVLPGSGKANSETAKNSSKVFDILAIIARDIANNISTLAGYERRMEEWDLQIELADQEMKQIDKQILGAMVRREIVAKEKDNLDLQIENAKQADAYMRNKYTNHELYNWLIGQVSGIYFQTYKMAYDLAKQAEKAFRFELGIEGSDYIKFGYWDNMRKGLLAGEKLHHDIKRLELAYLEKNKREYEITKHVSLAQLDPLALVRLCTTGITEFEIPEVVFDMDYPGQYFRRLKTVSISIPCISGPYTSISARLSLQKSKYRKNSNGAQSNYVEETGNDSRFVYSIGAIQSIATSHGQNDSGMFELNFRDDRYLPFEGMGAASTWRLELPAEVKQFNYATISDVIIHLKYTAREGGGTLQAAANTSLKEQLQKIKQGLNESGFHIALNVKQDMTGKWHLLKKNGTVDIVIDKSRLPYMIQSFDTAAIESIIMLAQIKDNPSSFTMNIDGAPADMARVDELQLCKVTNTEIELNNNFSLSVATSDIDKLEELLLIVKYTF